MSNNVLKDIKPASVFKFFEEICSIPHGSGNLVKISDYLVDFAKKRNLEYRQDESLNVIIRKPATKGSTGRPVIIQGHMDMVAVKTPDCNKDMEKEGLDLYVDGDYVKAYKTSLGGDDGIAVAYALAILDSDDIKHPDIEAIFTVDEETGMLGAEAIDCSDIRGRIMLNIDSEDEGIFLSSCAGGATVTAKYAVKRMQEKGTMLKLKVSDVTSGHSGTDIIYQRANANVIMGRLLFELSAQYNYVLESFEGGEKDNSIPPRCEASIVVDENEAAQIKKCLDESIAQIKSEYSVTDSNMNIEVCVGETSEWNAWDYASTNKAVLALTHIPDGVIKMSNDIKGLVQTSLNLGVVKTYEDKITMKYLLRSSVESEKEYLISRVTSMISLLGGEYDITGRYPAWEYKKESELRTIMLKAYKELTGKEAKIEAMHAGVECGLFAKKFDGLDCVSFGPDIIDIHTFNERLSISSVERTWELILEVLAKL